MIDQRLRWKKDQFYEIYISTDLSECERRDSKGFYKKARAGEIKNFTGISSPYEAPSEPDVSIDTTNESIESCVDSILKNVHQIWKDSLLTVKFYMLISVCLWL